MISLIVAMSQNRVIGSKNAMPWHIPGELARFKKITSGHPIIMGRKTFESIGRVLPYRLNIIITRDPAYNVEGALVVNSLDVAIRQAKKYYVSSSMYQEENNENEELSFDDAQDKKNLNSKYQIHDTENEVFIIGGGEIFKQAMPIADKLYLTLIHKDVEGDTYFPDYSEFGKELSREDKENDGYKYSFLELVK